MNQPQSDILDDFIAQPQAAKIGKRIGAAIIDGVILIIVWVVLGNLFGEQIYKTTTSTITTNSEDGTPHTTREITHSSEIRLNPLGTAVYIGCWFLLMPFMEGTRGQTIGKKALRLKVIRLNGDPTTIGTSFVRHLVDFIDCFFFIGLVIAASNPQHKRIADNLAGTFVVDQA